jgi:hypothetical protein
MLLVSYPTTIAISIRPLYIPRQQMSILFVESLDIQDVSYLYGGTENLARETRRPCRRFDKVLSISVLVSHMVKFGKK